MAEVHDVHTVDEAVELLRRLGDDAAALGGGTWTLRAPLRREPLKPHYVSLRGVEELGAIAAGDPVRIGALATHARIGGLEAGTGPLGALAEAARRSAFPAVRNVATIAGNVAARPFPEADLVPALLACDAALELASPAGRATVGVADYRGGLIAAALVPAPAGRRSWFERLTVRHAAEYSLVSVAVSVDLGEDRGIEAARVAVGAVEPAARRVPEAEAALRGRPPGAAAGEEAGRAAAAALTARDELDAPGWYRLAVLPRLLARALERIGAG